VAKPLEEFNILAAVKPRQVSGRGFTAKSRAVIYQRLRHWLCSQRVSDAEDDRLRSLFGG
jgi:hypothetical protein